MHEYAHGMRPLTALVPADEALRRILDVATPVNETEIVALSDALGRSLAEEVVADSDVPPFDRAAMDGFALRSADASAPNARLRIVGNVHAGHAALPAVHLGECVQIATGGVLPPGADAVAPVERTRMEEGHILLERAVRPRENVSARGSDVAAGTSVLSAGTVLTPARVAVAAAVGRARLVVWRKPRLAVLSTGSELRPPGSELRPGEIYDSNGPALSAVFRQHGADVVHGQVDDEESSLRARLRTAAAESDLLIASGASSAGEKDLLRDAVRAEGAIEFHGVRVKPGKPLLLGRIGATPIIGLPGYPTSCLSDAYLFVLPALRKIARLPAAPPRRVTARLAIRVDSVPDRLWFVPVRLEAGLARPTYKESGATTSLSDAVGYVAIPPDVPFLDEGDAVEVVLF